MNGPKKAATDNARAVLELELAFDDLLPRVHVDDFARLGETLNPLERAFVVTVARNLRTLAKMLERLKKANG